MKLYAQNVSKKFMRKRDESNVFYAVEAAELTLNPGQLTIISGHSGSGKSTLLNMLCGLLKPDEGAVLADECDLYSLDDAQLSHFRNQYFGIIPQGQTAIHSLTVLENVLLPVTLYGINSKNRADYDAASAYAKDLLELTGIEDLRDIFPKELSGGELRRMAIARSLIKKPAVIFADEPTGDLDDANTEIVMKLFRRIADEGTSILIVTHDKDIYPYADQIYDMKAGKLYLQS